MGNYPNSGNPFEMMGVFGIHLMESLKDMFDAFLESEYCRTVTQKFVDYFDHSAGDTVDKSNPQPCVCFNRRYGNYDPKCPVCGGSGVKEKWVERELRTWGYARESLGPRGVSQIYTRAGLLTRREIMFYFGGDAEMHNNDLIVATERDGREIEYRIQDARPILTDEDGVILFWKCYSVRQEHDQSTDRRAEL